MADKNRGLYEKFTVYRNDGSSTVGGKHFGCEYYVLDLDHDPHAIPALEAYADSCGKDYPLLARDLRKKALMLRDRAAERDYMATAFAAGWVITLASRHAEPGYSDTAALFEANRLGLEQADAMLAERAKGGAE